MSYAERNLGKNESIIVMAEPNWISLVPTIIGGIVIIVLGFIFSDLWYLDAVKGIGFIVALLNIGVTALKIKTTELTLTNKKVIGKAGILHTKVMDSPLNKVNNISVEQGLGGKIFGYGKVVVSTSSGSYEFQYLKNPDAFRSLVMQQIDIFDEERVRAQAEELARAVKK
ncbi:MAG: PH domain-containing protein [Oscillospiraceae bacterium]